MTISETAERCGQILDEVERVIVGKREVLRLVLLGILAGGHVLLEDLPGLGKTMMARSFARVLGLQFNPHPVHPRPAARGRDRGTGL